MDSDNLLEIRKLSNVLVLNKLWFKNAVPKFKKYRETIEKEQLMDMNIERQKRKTHIMICRQMSNKCC